MSKTAVIQNGTAPFTYSWTIDRALLSGESITNANSSTVTVCLLDTASLCITITDANGCVFTDCASIFAQDVRCFAGNSGDHKVRICHNGNSICVDQGNISSHLAHGDYYGYCTSNVMNSGEVAEEDISGVSFKIYPNPSSGRFAIYFNSNNEIKYESAEVINVSGQVIKQVKINNQTKIDLTIKDSGVYFIRLISAGNKTLVKKIVIIK